MMDMLTRVRTFFRWFNETTDDIRTICFWICVLFTLGCFTGAISVTTQSWLRAHGFISRAIGGQQGPIVGFEPPAPITVIISY